MDWSDWVRYRKQVLDKFECQQSGNCCRCPGVVYASIDTQTAMAKELNMSLIDFKRDFVIKKDGWELVSSQQFRTRCFLDKENKCRVYNARPIPCKTYPNWDSIWKTKATLREEAKLCPGLKKAIDSIG